MNKTVKDFYSEFDFEKIISNPPTLIQDFLDTEMAFINNHIKQSKDILEVGCGYGRLLKILTSKASNVVGVDFSAPLLEKGKKNIAEYANVQTFLMDAQDLRFNDASFDYVLCLDASFGNMPGIEERVVCEMARVMRDHGELIVSVFSEAAKDVQLENYRRVGLTNLSDNGTAVSSSEGFYSRRFTKEQLVSLFSVACLSCEIQSLCSINYVAIGRKILR